MQQATQGSYVGRAAPEFRLAAAQGGEVGPQDMRGSKNVVLWFSKGIFCPFCRRSMAQLGLRYPDIQAAGAEVLQVTHNTFDEARGYLKHYPIKMPYLCDAERIVHNQYGVEMLPFGADSLGGFAVSVAAVVTDLVTKGEKTPPPIPYLRRYAGKDSAQAVFVLDREGVVRAEHRLAPNAPLPSAADLIRALQGL